MGIVERILITVIVCVFGFLLFEIGFVASIYFACL